MKKIFNKIAIFILSITILINFTACDFGGIFGTNYEKLINTVSEEVLKGIVTVECTFTKVSLSGSSTKVSQGSGEIIAEKNGYYYVITNNHVVYTDMVRPKKEYIILDYLGNEYEAEVLKTSVEDDLALMRFVKGETALRVFTIANSNPKEDVKVISLGTPNGQRNYISLGKIRYYTDEINYDRNNSSNVSYEIIVHSAPIHSGSSGGALIDYDYNLIGVNFAGVVDESDNASYSCAIPIEKVVDFYEGAF